MAAELDVLGDEGELAASHIVETKLCDLYCEASPVVPTRTSVQCAQCTHAQTMQLLSEGDDAQ